MRLVALAGALASLDVAVWCSGCIHASTARDAYLAEHIECVHMSSTIEASKACRRAVDCRWKVGPCVGNTDR